MITPVILCGGAGTRLWPVSRKAHPKQFTPLISHETPYQATLRRFSGPDFTTPMVLTNEEFRFTAASQANDLGISDLRIVLEPEARDTAAAILCAALLLAQDDPEAVMLVSPSDHAIEDTQAFAASVKQARQAMNDGELITFGVPPDRPETGYGYLQTSGGGDLLDVQAFCEKPDAETATSMLRDGGYLWNAGLFLFRACDVISAFRNYAADLILPCQNAVEDGAAQPGAFCLSRDGYAAARVISFDYAVMEQAQCVKAMPLTCGWCDLGSWDALWQATPPDADGVAVQGQVTAIGCRDSYLRSDDDSIALVGLGLSNVIAVATSDAVLLADKNQVQDVSTIVRGLRAQNTPQADQSPRQHRPWGWYENLCMGDRFRVKRIMVRPGGALSLQSHLHRSEHWVVVAGTAEVAIGPETKLISENQSIYVPLGAQHRLKNPGRVPIYLIEVQTGGYLGEDDIIRYDDLYYRA